MQIVESLNYDQHDEAQHLYERINMMKVELNNLFSQQGVIDLVTLEKSQELDQLISQYMTLQSKSALSS